MKTHCYLKHLISVCIEPYDDNKLDQDIVNFVKIFYCLLQITQILS